MNPHSVKLAVTPCLHLECKFWLGDDGWNATVESLGVSVNAPTFETAKHDIELALGKHIETLLGEHPSAHAQAA
ncbi:MAG TPA: hypothetical protein VEI49_01225 [Terriglobales bacterium]|nr:hypothetical protein [Terriglobales bacterium]